MSLNCRLQVADYRWGVQDAGCRWGGGGVAGCGLQEQMHVAYKYGSFVHLGKVKKIRNLGCSCPGSDLVFLSRDSDRGLAWGELHN